MNSLLWKCNVRRNANSDFAIVTMRRDAIIFFEAKSFFRAVKNFMQKF